MNPRLTDVLGRAVERREPLRSGGATTAYRLVHDRADGLADLTLDWFDAVAVLSLYRQFSAAQEQQLVAAVVEVAHPRALYLKRRPKEARIAANAARDEVAPTAPVYGEPVESCTVAEEGLRFAIRPGQGLSVGLYLDMRDTRSWARARLGGAAVLNCFAYTCAFSVAARAGGAAKVVNVDLSRRVLRWGEENAELNGQPIEPKDYLAGDVFEWLRRLAKREARFEAVILDPPSFSKAPQGVFSSQRDYPRLVQAAAAVLGPGGLLIACSNHAAIEPSRFERQVRQGLEQAGRGAQLTERLGPSPLDFPATKEQPAALKVLVWKVR
jgi:23S rRNA (cytosine1962-C5)-methyltransferase